MKLHTLALALFTVSVAALAACGGGSGPKIKSFAASDTSLPEGGVDVTFTWDVKNAGSLELLPMPGAVSGTSATVNVSESTTFTLVAKKDGRSARKSIDVVVGAGFSVTGFAYNYYTGATTPAIGATVAIGDQVTLTDEDGRFHFDDVVAPYDLVVMTDYFFLAGASYYIDVYKDVTIPNPTVATFRQVVSPVPPPPRSATVSGTVGGGVTLPAANVTNYFFAETADGGTVSAGDSDSPYSYGISWNSEATTSELVQNVVQYDSVADTYAYARSTGTVTDGGNLVLNPTLASVSNVTFNVALDAPWASSLSADASFGFQEYNDPEPEDFTPFYTITTADVLVATFPDIAGLYRTLSVSAYDDDGASYYYLANPDESTLTSLVVGQPPRILTPVQNAIVGPETAFSVSAAPDAVKVFGFRSGSFFGASGVFNAYLSVYTDDSEITFPDLGSLGLPFPHGQQLTWDVYTVGPWNSLDEALSAPYGPEYPQGGVEIYGDADSRNFSTEGSAPSGDDDDAVGVMEAQYVGVPEN